MTDHDYDRTLSDGYVDHTFTRVLSREFELDGVTFSWWAIDDKPAFVTVSSQWFGNKVALSDRDPAEFAVELARQLMREHYDRARLMQAKKTP